MFIGWISYFLSFGPTLIRWNHIIMHQTFKQWKPSDKINTNICGSFRAVFVIWFGNYMKINEKIHFLFSRFTKHEKEPVMFWKKQIINSEGTPNILINLCLEIYQKLRKSPRCTINQIYHMPGNLYLIEDQTPSLMKANQIYHVPWNRRSRSAVIRG